MKPSKSLRDFGSILYFSPLFNLLKGFKQFTLFNNLNKDNDEVNIREQKLKQKVKRIVYRR